MEDQYYRWAQGNGGGKGVRKREEEGVHDLRGGGGEEGGAQALRAAQRSTAQDRAHSSDSSARNGGPCGAWRPPEGGA